MLELDPCIIVARLAGQLLVPCARYVEAVGLVVFIHGLVVRPRAGLDVVVKVALYRHGVALIDNAILCGVRAVGWKGA